MSDKELSNVEKQPWVDEPDEVNFVHKGLVCLILRGPLGNLNGYVSVPFSHPLWNSDYSQVNIDVHGGLTFSGFFYESDEYPRRDPWWLGFDCGHGGDIIPSVEALAPGQNRYLSSEFGMVSTYKDIEYVTQEVKHLADRLSELSGMV